MQLFKWCISPLADRSPFTRTFKAGFKDGSPMKSDRNPCLGKACSCYIPVHSTVYGIPNDYTAIENCTDHPSTLLAPPPPRSQLFSWPQTSHAASCCRGHFDPASSSQRTQRDTWSLFLGGLINKLQTPRIRLTPAQAALFVCESRD